MLGCMLKVGIAEASRMLGLSQDTVRKRLRSGELAGEKVKAAGGFRWVVDLEEEDVAPAEVDQDHGDLVELLKVQVQDLRDQLDTRTREISELHQLMAARSLNASHARPWWRFWG